MRVITIAARKGGVGKTTLATHLSVMASSPDKPALLIDTDPQRSLAWWWKLRDADTPAIIECDARELRDIIPAAKNDGFNYVIIDTPPHAETSIADAMRASDLVLVPTRPGPFDLAAVATTFGLAQRVGKPVLAVLNHTPPRTTFFSEPSIVSEARQVLAGMGATVAKTAIAQRVSLSHAIISGSTVSEFEPTGKAAAEIKALWLEIQKTVRA